jgi:Flp pilus assembly protein TadG
MRGLRDLLRRESGAVALVFGLATPLVIGGALLAVDATALVTTQSHLQSIADATALAGAKELHVYTTDPATIPQAVRQRALTLLAEEGLVADNPLAAVEVNEEEASVTVTVSVTPKTMALGRLGYAEKVSAKAVANAFGSVKLCVLALDEDGGAAIRGARIASIDAPECAVQSNSTQPDGIDLDLLSSIRATGICSAGGVEGSSFSPEPATDCPPIEDPLVQRTLPGVGACDYIDLKIILPRTIRPGHYCGGLTLGPTALVNAEPGEYVFSGGPLVLGPASSLIGENVGFRFMDEQSTFTFGLGSIVQLSAPSTGPMAGFLFYQEPGLPKGQQFTIATDLATKLLGTIYLPSGTLKVDVVGLVAAQSAYTVVVADRIDVNGAHLVINSNYGATDVPVPAGVGPTGGQVALSR